MSPLASQGTPALADRIREAVQSGKVCLPPLPELATSLISLLRDEERCSARGVAELIGTDPAMTAGILRMANSAIFGGLRTVSDLDQAVARLGMQRTGALVTTVIHKGHFHTTHTEWNKYVMSLWDHAITTALGARHFAGGVSCDVNEAYLAGLLHDAGKLLVLKGVDEVTRGTRAPYPTPPVIEELMNLLHAQLGYETMMGWRLPGNLCRVVLHHHDTDPTGDDYLLIAVQAANAVSRKMGMHPWPDPDLNLLKVRAVERLGLDDIELAALMVDLEDEFNAIREML